VSPQVQNLLADAQQAYQQATTDLAAGLLGAYQNDITRMENDLQTIRQLTGNSGTTSPSSTTTTAPTKNGKTTTPTTSGKSSTSTTVKPKTTTPSTAPA